MKKIILWISIFLFLLIFFILGYLSLIGYETDKFNSFLEKKVDLSIPNAKINLNKIKIKIDIKNLSFFLTTQKPLINYQKSQINVKKIDAYINLKSLLLGAPKIDKINITSDEIGVNQIKKIIKYQKPSNLRKFFLNEVNSGNLNFKLDLELIENKIQNYEINGIVKNFFSSSKNLNFEKTSFTYSFKKDSGEIDNIRGLINGFQINSGNIEFNNSESLNLKGNLKSDLKLGKSDFKKFFKKETLFNFKEIKVSGKLQSSFKINFDKTLKVIDYEIKSSGDIQNSEIKLKEKEYVFLKDKINKIVLEKIIFKINYDKGKKKLISLSGKYKLNNNLFQRFDLKNIFDSNNLQLIFNGDFDNEIDIPLINFNSKNKVSKISTVINLNKDRINVKKFLFKEDKNEININNLIINNKRLIKFDNIQVKTLINGQYNNDFKIKFGKEIKIEGSKYDASNLTKIIDQNDGSNFFKKLSKEITLNIKEISTNDSDLISNFNLIGNIDKGKFSKIVSKGEFKDGKYLDISVRVDKSNKKKILEIYSDLPKPLLSNYKFFNGLSGGQLLIFSTYDSKTSDTNLIVENFKVKNAPGLVKLLSLADFGGMVDAVSGDGLSFEKLEMSINKNNNVLSLTELYAIGPSISILMDGYVESETGLVSLRGTMVPAKTLNKFLAKLPIVGDILIPKEIGEGLFGISFKMKGYPGRIKTTVNPIKTLTPRFIQKAINKKPK